MKTFTAPIRVVVIDHRPIVCSALEHLIGSRAGFEIVARGAEPLSVAGVQRLRTDVVLLSVGADVRRAFAFLGGLRDTTVAVRALLLTEATDRDLHRDAIRLGAYGVLSPECSPDKLIKALECIARGEYWIDRVTAAALAQPSRSAQASVAGGPDDRFATLTARENDIVALIADGLRNKEISLRLNISETTVRHHLTSIFAKLQVSDRLALVVHAFRNGLVGRSEPSAPAPRRARTSLVMPKAAAQETAKRVS
jgi:two-component system, NarL family, nitrate/nitrite response regulator NarL